MNLAFCCKFSNVRFKFESGVLFFFAWTFGDPIFLSMGHFLYRFSTFCEKMKKIYRVEVRIVCAPSDSVLLTDSFSCAAFSKERVCENDGNI